MTGTPDTLRVGAAGVSFDRDSVVMAGSLVLDAAIRVSRLDRFGRQAGEARCAILVDTTTFDVVVKARRP